MGLVDAAIRLVLLALVAALPIVGAVGCGDSSDEGDTAADRTVQAARQDNLGGNKDTTKTKPADERGTASNKDDGGRLADPTLSGNIKQARAGAVAVDGVYEQFAKAAKSGVTASDIPVGKTLQVAEGNNRLTSVCDLMSQKAQQATIAYAKGSAGLTGIKWTCQKATALLLRRTRQAGKLKRMLLPELIGVNASRSRATATVRFGGRKGHLTTIPLVREDGQWKLGTTSDAGNK